MPNQEFNSLVGNITQARLQLAETFSDLVVAREGVKVTQYAIDGALEKGLEINTLTEAYNGFQTAFADLQDTLTLSAENEATLLTQFFSIYDTQAYQVSNLNDQIPILFFPVRLETTFKDTGSGYELWVRIFPDDIAVETHEALLTQDEIDQGQAYWKSTVGVNGSATQVEKNQAWDLLSRSYGAQRAAWVALQTKPTSGTTAAGLVFPTLSPKSDSWTLQPVTRILPDAFVINCYATDYYSIPSFSAQTNPIPDEVRLGFNPSNTGNDATFYRSGDDIATDPTDKVDWMVDFDAAIAKGLGVKIPINDESYQGGFRRIIAVGVKVTLTKEASQTRLQNLIDSHHYTDGFSLLKQGTSTNNTDKEYSGYGRVDFGNETTYATERGASNLFTPSPYAYSKTDGQVLCEALGIDYDPLYHIYHADGFDIRDAMNFNNSFWLCAMGYYLVSMADVDTSDADRARDFFQGFVRSRGALPSIRSGIQPYGILPASVYSRMVWGNDPDADLYQFICDSAVSLSANWATAVADIAPYPGTGNNSQIALNSLARNAVSLNYVQRMGFGAGLIWNYLVYSEPPGSEAPMQWYQQQSQRIQQFQAQTGLNISRDARINGINFLPEHTNLSRPMVAAKELNRKAGLPQTGGDGLNYLNILSQANFYELAHEDYERFNVPDGEQIDTMLYRFARQTLLLEYHDAACKLMGLPESERKDPELINMSIQEGGQQPPGPTMRLSAGANRWAVLSTPYGGFRTVTDYIDARGRAIVEESAEPINLFTVKQGLGDLADLSIGDLELLSSEMIDCVSFRLDAWQLALVNQRLNVLRGITEGSSSRQQGIYLGAYGWVENVTKRDKTAITQAPNSHFALPLLYDSPNEGYLHAPSINQAAAAAVLRSGYATRGNTTGGGTLAVNIASERVRYAMDILEGMKNGQGLSLLLGYHFERFMYESVSYNPGRIIDSFIDDLRVAFPAPTNTIPYTAPTPSTPSQAENVLDGQKLIDAYKTAGNNVATALSNNGIILPAGTGDVLTGIGKGIDWMMNLIDAVSDQSTAEGVFQLVQGNQAKSGAIAEAIAKGSNIPEIDVTATPRTGTAIGQRFTLHIENNTTTSAGWSYSSVPLTPRAKAEPYLNRWIGQLLGSPTNIQCTFKTTSTVPVDTVVTVADLGLQPIDLVFMLGDQIGNDASELALRVRHYARSKIYTVGALTGQHIGRAEIIDINFKLDVNSKPVSIISFLELIALLKSIRDLITSSRSLRTTDYIPPTEAAGVTNNYDNPEFYTTRLTAVLSDFNTAVTALSSALPATATSLPGIKTALFNLSFYGLGQTVYEFVFDTTTEDVAAVDAQAQSVLAEANARLDNYYKIFPLTPAVVVPAAGAGSDEFIERSLKGYKALLGREFIALPQFKLRTADKNLLNTQLGATLSTTLLSNHTGNPYVMDEWVAGVAKVRKNTANYEFLSMLASGIDLDAFIDKRKLRPAQIPYGGTTSGDEWLGTRVSSPALIQEGRVSFGISVPGGSTAYAVSDYEVGLMIDEWVDVIPNSAETTGIAFHANQPNQKPPQCLLLGLTPAITGSWHWNDIVDMINETFDLAKNRAVGYDSLSGTAVAQFGPTLVMPFSSTNATIAVSSYP